MENVIINRSQKTINWNQIYSLMGLNAAIVISWIAYHNYQPKVLELFNFQELALFLVVAQAIILVVIPPVAGLIGDYFIKAKGNRLIVFTVGISVTAMTFMAVAFTLKTADTINLIPFLPYMIIVWLISMNIFNSPANSMLELFAPAKELPIAMAMLTMTTELLYALEPVVVWFVDTIGPVLTFVTGGVLIIVSGYFFNKTTKNITLNREYEEVKSSRSNIALVLIVALVLGLATAILMNKFPSLLASKLQIMNSEVLGGAHYVSIILAISALAAWPLSIWISKFGLVFSITLGTVSTFIFIGAVYLVSEPVSTIICCLFLAISYSILSVSAFPFALSNLSKKNVTFGAGLFFGFLELADGLMNIWGAL